MQHKRYKKIVLVVLDGFGVASFSRGNAIALAEPQHLNHLVQNYPSLTLQASGPLVGLPWREMGNSEVGHLNIGAGRIVGQDLPRITNAIQDRSFFRNPVFAEAVSHAKKNGSRLHLVGMFSGGGVHSLDEHLYALLGLAAEQGITEVFVHLFTDGRDTAQKVARGALEKFRQRVERIGIIARIATISGRFFAMDRGQHWDQTEMTFQAMVNGIGAEAETPEACLDDNYNRGVFDEMIKPTVIIDSNPSTGSKMPVATIRDNDAIIFFNFRPDRMVQLVQAFIDPDLMQLPSKHRPLENVYLATMTEYLTNLPVHVAFPSLDLHNNLAELVSRSGMKQFHIAESEKYPHVTSFFNGGVSQKLPGETREIITSPNNTKNYLDHPEMSAEKLTELLVENIMRSDYQLYVVNYANPDMVGHTGSLDASIHAVQCVDAALQKVTNAVLAVDGALIITGDHGNVEQMIDAHSGEINKDHTTNPVPFLLIAHEFDLHGKGKKDYISLSSAVPAGVISDIAPTILSLFGIPKPPEMTGINLLDMLESQK
jgi:2,3-bisphosphoglycerate-independent phosphoglycerate mutase